MKIRESIAGLRLGGDPRRPSLACGRRGPIAEKLQAVRRRPRFAGAVVLVSSAEKDLDVEAVGWADIASKKPMRKDSLFWIASMSKPITATALMMLVDEGKVGLDDPVEHTFPNFAAQMLIAEKSGDLVVLKKPGHAIKVREILSHTSGLVGRSPLEGKLDSLPLHEGSITYGLSPLHFEPGTKYEYCNPGINTSAGSSKSRASTPYEDFLQKRIFDPLGMKDTTFRPTAEQAGRIAKSYRPNKTNDDLDEIEIDQLTYPLSDRSKRHAYPAGGLFSTAADLSAFCRMILAGGTACGRRLVSESSIREMTSTQTGGPQDQGGYGLGWSTSKRASGSGGPVIPGHCGHGGAYSTSMNIDPERGLITVSLVQHAGFPKDSGGKIQDAFSKSARELFSKPK